MATPKDYWTLEIQINYNNMSTEKVEGSGRGWREKYFFDAPDLNNPPVANMQTVIAARAACMASNEEIFSVRCSLASRYKDTWGLGTYVKQPITSQYDLVDEDSGDCNSVENALLIRFENSTGRFWERVLRGVRDSWISDEALSGIIQGSSTTNIYSSSYGPNTTVMGYTPWSTVSPVPLDLVVPDLLSQTPIVGTTGLITITVGVGGAITGAVTTTPGTGLSFNNDQNATQLVVFTPLTTTGPWGTYVPHPPFDTITVVLAGGIIQAAPAFTANFSTYTPGTYLMNFYANETGDVFQPYLKDEQYLLNFAATLNAYCVNFTKLPTALADMPPSDFKARWPALTPSGQPTMVPMADTNVYPSVRFMVERVTNRQTGRMNVRRRARKKIAR